MIQFPNISPEIFNFNFLGFNLVLRWYAVSYIAGFFCALFVMKYFVKRAHLWENSEPPLTKDQADNLLTYLILGVIVGGRLGYVLFYNLEYYISRPFDIFRVWDGGMSFHGGFLGVIVAVYLYARFNGLALWVLADLIALASPPGLFFGRVANFINIELWGSPTTLPWGVVFPGEAAQNCGQFIDVCARHPTQLYEAILEGIFLFLLLLFVAFKGGLKYPKFTVGVFSLGYGLSRYFVEFFRVPDAQFVSVENPHGYAFEAYDVALSMGQLLSMPMIIAGILLILLSIWAKKLDRGQI